ncbi:MAG: flagellar basal body rod protein FlgC [Phycisphaerales bacterium]|nr:flagellar basal body rod protein FlgC [Phycisphaerales bacterium]
MFSTMDISTSALVAQRTNLDTIAGNIANMYATRDANGFANPYRRRVPLFASGDANGGAGVRIAKIVESQEPFRLVLAPDHPDAIKSGPKAGYVRMPNVNYSTEMVNALMASRVYEANVTVMDISKTMASASLRMLA